MYDFCNSYIMRIDKRELTHCTIDYSCSLHDLLIADFKLITLVMVSFLS